MRRSDGELVEQDVGRIASYGDFAAELGVPIGTVKRWVHEGMPVVRMGPRVAVDVVNARRWVGDRGMRNRKGHVYFARGPNGTIKIGFTSDLGRRMSELGAEVVATVPGSIALEYAIHDLFREDRIHGEWFRPSRALLAFIEELRT